jgi:hypothetical protein
MIASAPTSRLTSLGVLGNGMGDAALVALVETQIVELDVRSNGLKGPGILAVCEHATALRRLSIGGNSLDPATKAALKALSKQLHVVMK